MKSILTFIFLCLYSSLSYASLEINVPFSPGGAVDIIGRHLGEYLQKNGYPNFITNTPGAGGDIGLNHILKKKNNVMMISGHGAIIFTALEQKKENVYIKDTSIFGPIFSVPQGFLVPTEGFKNIYELTSFAKNQELPCGVSNPQGSAEIKKFNTLHGTKFIPVNYKGSADLRRDLFGNHIKCAYDTLGSHYPSIRSSEIRLLSITQPEKDFENVPLLSSVLPSGSSFSWYAIVLPKDSNLLSDAKLLELLNEYSRNPEVQKEMKEKGFSPSKIDKNFHTSIEETTKNYRQYFQ
jgi:tripartite-type tricarboxylate transporter receptor subunit TctC